MNAVKIDWHEQAACVGEDPERFFPVGRDPLLAEPAKQVCRRCPALRDCLAYALLNAVAGVWGGTTEAERDELRTRHRIAPHPVTLHLVEDDIASQVVEMSRGGASIADICIRLGISPSTVSYHRARAREQELSHDEH